MLFCLAVYLHRIDPFAVRFPDLPLLPDGLRWYGLSYLAGFVIAYLLVRRVTRTGISTLKPANVSDLVLTMAIGVVVGGRLGYVLLYQPSLLAQFTSAPPFWGLVAINQGGMASHGGIIGIIVAGWWYARRHSHDTGHLLDLAAFGAAPGVFFGRVANFINGELIGRPCDPALPWAVKFPQELYQLPADHLPYIEGAPTLDAMIAQIQQGNEQVIRIVEPLLTARHPSQLYEAVLEGLIVFAVLVIVWAQPRKPWVLTGVTLVTYGIVRIIGEFFRTPDAQIADQEFAHLGVTRGQWLSALVVIAGFVIVLIASRRSAPLMGSWRRQPVSIRGSTQA